MLPIIHLFVLFWPFSHNKEDYNMPHKHEYAKPGDPPVLNISVYYSKGDNDNGHDLAGWYWFAAFTGHANCWFGEPEGPFPSAELALAHATAEYVNRL